MSTMTLSTTTMFPARPHDLRGPVRLTRRGRLVLLLAALLVALVLGVVWGAGSVATERPGAPEPTRVVTVQPGDTLFGLAATVTVDGDVAAMVERIQSMNALDSSMLAVGQKVTLPVTK